MLWQKWTREQEAALEQMYTEEDISPNQMEQFFNRNWDAIKAKAISLGLCRSSREWKTEEIDTLSQMYTDDCISSEEMERMFNRGWVAIRKKAAKLGLRRPRPNPRKIKRDYFKIISTEKQAYYLGLLAADGAINLSGKQHTVELRLHPDDMILLEQFRDDIVPGASIRRYQGFASVDIGSKEMVKDLARFGIVPRKCYDFCWPDALADALAIPFILGYFDGDGNLHKRRHAQSWQWSLVGCRGFLTRVRDYIQYHAQVAIHEPAPADKRVPHLYYIRATGQRAIAIDRTLNGSGLGLPRKHLGL